MKETKNYFNELVKKYEKYFRFPPMNHHNIAAFTLWDRQSKEAIMVTFFKEERPQINVTKIEIGKNRPNINYHDYLATVTCEEDYALVVATLDKYIHALSV